MEMGKFTDRKLSQRDMEFTALRGFSKDQIMEAYRVSKAMLGSVEDVNRSTAEAQQVIFAEEVIVPRLERWKKLLNHKLLPRLGNLGDGVEFDYDTPVPKNATDIRLQERADVLNASSIISLGGEWGETLEAFGLPAISREFIPPQLGGSSEEQGDTEPVNVEPGEVGEGQGGEAD
jgi:hypothetical protein